MRPDLIAVACGLSAAIAWGAADFYGGLASRRGRVFAVILGSQVVGAVGLVALALLTHEVLPSRTPLLEGAAAGIAGTLGLCALYTALARTRMGLVAPVSALVTAILPIAVAAVTEGLPKPLQALGLIVALIAVWLLASSGWRVRIAANELALPIAAGIGFGLFFILIGRIRGTGPFWPLVSARVATLPMMGSLVWWSLKHRPGRGRLPCIPVILAGLCDAGGNAFFFFATHLGRLDIAAALSSLYPATTVLLAWLILMERLRRHQWTGVGAAVLALMLIAH